LDGPSQKCLFFLHIDQKSKMAATLEQFNIYKEPIGKTKKKNLSKMLENRLN